MTKQKRGFWLFIASLMPGAGEMYMGFLKRGLSIMILFWLLPALSSSTGFDWFIFLCPVIWCYSFFDTHNLKSLSEEEFYSIEDSFILHLDSAFATTDFHLTRHRKGVAIVLILFGVSILLNNFIDVISWLLPSYFANSLSALAYSLPQLIVAVGIIIAGLYFLSGKKERLDQESSGGEEHYWEPYRPFQQSQNVPDESVFRKEPEEHTVFGNEILTPDDQPLSPQLTLEPETPNPKEPAADSQNS